MATIGSSVTTLFYQGNTCSQSQLAKYTAGGFIATTGERVWCDDAIDVVKTPFIGCEANDIDLQPFHSLFSYLNPITLGLVAKAWLSNKYYGIHVSPPQDGPTAATVAYHGLNLSRLSIGQDSDIRAHHCKYNLWKQQYSDEQSLILYGISRGAATTFNAFARYQYPEVKLVVLEGCFNHLGDLLRQRFGRALGPIAEYALTKLAYRYNGPSPKASVENFPENVPVVLISSRIDETVPYDQSRELATALAERGKNDVYLLTLENSSHPNYMFDDDDDRNNYQNFIHAIYRKYQLPHNVSYAAFGEDLVEKSQLASVSTTHCSFFSPAAIASSSSQVSTTHRI